jgi:hypothetical protein
MRLYYLTHYVNNNYQYFRIKTWDGASWVHRNWGYTSQYNEEWLNSYDISPWLPDADGKYRVMFEWVQRYGWQVPDDTLVDFVGMLFEEYTYVPEIYYTKIDPSKDDQDGDRAVSSDIRLIPVNMISSEDGTYSMWPSIAIDDDDNLHVPWLEQSDWGNYPGDLVYTIIDSNGKKALPIIPLTQPDMYYAGSTWTNTWTYPTLPYIIIDNWQRMHTVWCDVRNGVGNIYHASTNIDVDNDGLVIYAEFLFGTTIGDPDTDGDGLTDGQEVLIHTTDPLDPDTDDDILSDGDEVLNVGTDPLDFDTDDGGVGDGMEVFYYSTDPFYGPDDPIIKNYEKTIEATGTSDWFFTDLWHMVYDGTTQGVITSIYNITHSGLYAWWYGIEATGTFDTGSTTSGTLMTTSITIPDDYEFVFLQFWTLWQIESSAPTSYDEMEIYVVTDSGTNWQLLDRLNPSVTPPGGNTLTPLSSVTGVGGVPEWEFHIINLTSYIGRTFQIAFLFDSGDSLYNYFRGWYLNEIIIVGGAPVEEEEAVEKPGININIGIHIPGGPKAEKEVTYVPGIGLESDLKVPEGKEEEAFVLTPLDWFLILFIILLAATLITTLQIQKRRMENMIKSRCVSGQQTRLLDVSDQMKDAMDVKGAGGKISAGNMVRIIDVKGNMVEVGTEIGQFLVPADFLACAEGMEEMEPDRDRSEI